MQSEILSDEELADITGYKARAPQRRWLDDRKWLYVESRGKRPLVGRQYARMKLGMISPAIIDPNPLPAVSHVFNMAREWGLTNKENPCQGVRKNKETPRDYYANDVVWNAVYQKAGQELKDAMDLAYLTGQRPADVLVMRKDDIEGGFLMVQQNKTSKKLRIQMTINGAANSLGLLVAQIAARNAQHVSSYLIVSKKGEKG